MLQLNSKSFFSNLSHLCGAFSGAVLPVIWSCLVLVGARAKQKGKPLKPASDGLLTLPCSLERDLSTCGPGPLGNHCSILPSYRPTEWERLLRGPGKSECCLVPPVQTGCLRMYHG